MVHRFPWERGHPDRTPRADERLTLPGTSKCSTSSFASKGKLLLSGLPGLLVLLLARHSATPDEPSVNQLVCGCVLIPSVIARKSPEMSSHNAAKG